MMNAQLPQLLLVRMVAVEIETVATEIAVIATVETVTAVAETETAAAIVVVLAIVKDAAKALRAKADHAMVEDNRAVAKANATEVIHVKVVDVLLIATTKENKAKEATRQSAHKASVLPWSNQSLKFKKRKKVSSGDLENKTRTSD